MEITLPMGARFSRYRGPTRCRAAQISPIVRPAGGKNSSFLKSVARCSAARLTCCTCLLTTTGGVTGRRHRAEGASQEEQQVRDKNKNSAIVRVCQLRMIVWLVDPPLVSSASHPHPNRGTHPTAGPGSGRGLTARGRGNFVGWPQPRNSAASTLRSSCTSTLKVRHAAPSCMTSSPTRRRANSLRTSGGAKR